MPVNEIDFPASPDGRRSSSALGRAVVADALRVADPRAADAAAAEPDWRRGYLRHFRALVEAGLTSPDAGYEIARAGLASIGARIETPAGTLADALAAGGRRPLGTVEVTGRGTPVREVVLPYRGSLLRGADLDRRLDAWVAAGTIEPSCAGAVREVAAHPDWLDLSGLRLVVLGAGAEMGPLPALLGWGATVAGIDLPRPQLWERITTMAASSAGTLIAPAGPDGQPGADLLTDAPAVADWLLAQDGRLVLGNYVYAPGATYVRLSAAVDALCAHIRRHRPDTALALLATPTDVFAVPGEAVAQATGRFDRRSRRSRAATALTGGGLLKPNYPPGADPGICDSLIPQQGPNYALAKRIQRWRAAADRRETTVSFSVAPPTRTRSVLSNRLIAAAYAGAHLFDVEVFAPDTANTLMAVLLVHQLRNPRPAAATAWHDEAFAAAHGGLWRTAYLPRTALGLAAVRGLPAAF